MPLEKAQIPVLDRGFIFGDGVYEVIPSYSGKPFRLKEHLKRLQFNLDSIRLKNPHTVAEWAKLIAQLVEQNQNKDQSIYLHITRGPAKRDHVFPTSVQPTVFMMSTPLQRTPPEILKTGVAAVTAQDNRWLRCDIKSISLLPNVLLRQLAADHGAAETILIRDGFLTEGAASNIFVIKNGVVLAPPKNHLILPGITYDVVLELAATHSIPYEIRPISEIEVRSAQELWMTSSGREILAITLLNGQPVADGKPGKLFWRMFQLYQDYKASVMRQSETQTI
ncbi:MAG TPA: D-amino acid aminotransferase [Burkholderiales bacterium]|nr:D-amino acid aminotransferase [Burkholderiales bacterium]